MTEPAIETKVRGVDDLRRGAAHLFARIEDGAQADFRSVADQVASLVRARVPRRTGALAATVAGEQTERGALVGMGGELPYAGWIEFGGGHGRPYIDAGRYLTPTAIDAAPLLERAGETTARREIARMTWPIPT